MSYAIKYQYDFKTFQGDSCTVYLFFKDYSGGVTYLNPGIRPFVLKEFNTDQDFFKPIRGFQAEMDILANNVTLDDFLSNEDDGVQVQLYFNGSPFWIGWLMQDDFQEDWTDANHFITLRATDGLGQISQDGKITIDGLGAMDEYLSYAIDSSPIPSFIGTTIINNLFYDGMNDRADGANTPLSKVYCDGKTFEGDDNEKIVEKINKSWTQTLYQYASKWWFVRQEEFLHNTNIQGIVKGALANTTFSKTFEASIGVNEGIKPIVPNMLRTIKRPFKETRIEYKYEFPDEIVCNQNFLDGALIIPTTDTYSIDCWTYLRGVTGSTTAATGQYYRKEEKDVDGNITDNYAVLEAPATQAHILRSSPIYINVNDRIDFGFDIRKPFGGSTPVNILACNVTVENGGTVYYLDSDGNWVTSTGFGGLRTYINIPYSATEDLQDWKTISIRSKAVPAGGILKIWLYSPATIVNIATEFRNIEFGIREASKLPGVIGDYDTYTLNNTVRNNYLEQTYLDDSNNRAHKGALFFNNDLTGDNWYRMDYPAERLTFKRHKGIAHMLMNKRYRNKLEVTMLGVKWMDGATERVIGLMNKFRFVDDAPTKTFMISNLSELDFAAAQWKGTLIEVYDDDIDTEDLVDYPDHSFGNIYQRDVN